MSDYIKPSAAAESTPSPASIGQLLDTIKMMVSKNSDLIGELVEVINPVLVPPMPEVSTAKDSIDDHTSPYAMELQSIVMRLEDQARYVRWIMSRVNL